MANTPAHTVHIPLVGIELHTPASPLGQVVLKQMAGEQIDELAQRLEGIMRQTDGTQEEIEQLVLLQLPQILDSFRETVVAEFVTEAAPDQIQEYAEAAC